MKNTALVVAIAASVVATLGEASAATENSVIGRDAVKYSTRFRTVTLTDLANHMTRATSPDPSLCYLKYRSTCGGYLIVQGK